MKTLSMIILDLSTLPYRQAWAEQERIHAEVIEGGEEAIILVEHAPVITMGRRGESLGVHNLTATPQVLADRGVEFVQTDRGGDITFHGPGQLVAYPIIRLIDHKLSVGGYVKALQNAVIATLDEFGIAASTDPAGVGVWVSSPSPGTPGAGRGEGSFANNNNRDSSERLAAISEHGDSPKDPHPNPLPGYRERAPSKIAAVGVRVKRGVTLHGLALNVTTDLSYFDLIVPCGIADRRVTSMREILGDRCPPMADVKTVITRRLNAQLG